jgi:hypothetical protein
VYLGRNIIRPTELSDMMRLGFLALLLLSAADAEAKRSLRCLPSGDHVPINEAFANGAS